MASKASKRQKTAPASKAEAQDDQEMQAVAATVRRSARNAKAAASVVKPAASVVKASAAVATKPSTPAPKAKRVPKPKPAILEEAKQPSVLAKRKRGSSKAEAAAASSSSSSASADIVEPGPTVYSSSATRDGVTRCWDISAKDLEKYSKMGLLAYHDFEWGRPQRDPQRLFEQLCLQMMQSGLSWTIVLQKRAGFKAAFDDFDYNRIAKYTEKDVARLLLDERIIRNQLKIRAIITNAKKAVELDKSYPGGFAKYFWDLAPTSKLERFISVDKDKLPPTHMRTDFKTKPEDRDKADAVHPTISVGKASDAAKKKGFSFVGPTTMLSFMQVAGMVNHHRKNCTYFEECNKEYDQMEPL